MQPWEPANDTERAMAVAMRDGDIREYFRTVRAAALYLPVLAADRASPGPQRFLTVDLLGLRYVPIFTSTEALAAAAAAYADAYTVTDYFELRTKWPTPAWRLMINPGTPIDAYVTIEAVDTAANGELEFPLGTELLTAAREDAEREPGGRLRRAVHERDVNRYVTELLDTDVILGTAEPVDAERFLEPEFPWLEGTDGAIAVYTSVPAFLTAGRPFDHFITVPFVAIVTRWPDPAHRLDIDPGTDLALTVTGEKVQGLVGWLDES
jgi:hypothetical protein